MSAADPSALVPDGPFVIEGELGEGRTAVVYAARVRGTGRPVALKVARGEAHEAALFAEFAVAGALRHPHLVTAEQVTRLPDGRLAVSMDRVDGVALAETHLADDERMSVALGIVRALCVLHGRGGHHGDLSPNNVLVERGDDGAQARLIDATPGDRSARVGTPGFIAPEVLAGGPQGSRSDLYALGCLLHVVLADAPIFDVPPDRLGHHHLNTPAEVDDDLHPEVAEALDALLAKSPDERLPGAERMLEALVAATGGDVDAELDAVGAAIIGGDRVIGRADARRPLVEMLERLQVGQGGVRWVHGPSGAGRTALRRWVAAEAARSQVIPIELSGSSADPLGAALELLEDPPGAVDRETAVVSGWAAAAERHPRCVLVDLDAPDPVGHRALVEALAAASRLAPLSVIVFATEPSAPQGITVQPLAPLASPERRGLVFDRLDDDGVIGLAVADALDDPTLSWPGQCIAALRGLISRRIMVRGAGGWVLDQSRLAAELPAVLDEAALAEPPELARCSATERQVLAACAVHGPLDDEALIGLLGPMGAIAANALERRGLLSEREGALRPVSSTLARAALRGLSAESRAALHRAAAELLVGPDAPARPAAARAVWHRVRAGDPVAARDRVSAADALLERGDSVAALACLEGASTTARGERDALAIAASRVYMARGRPDAALEALTAAAAGEASEAVRQAEVLIQVRTRRNRAVVEAARPDRDPPVVRAWTACAQLWLGEHDAALAAAEALLEQVPDAAWDARALARHVLATVAWQRGQLEAAEAQVQQALVLVEERDRALQADLLRTLGGVRIYRSDFDGAATPLEQAVQINRGLGRVPELAKSLNNLGIMHYQQGALVPARQAFEEYRLLAGRLGDPVELANVDNNLSLLVLRMGEPQRAIALAEQAIGLATRAEYHRLLPVARSNLGAALAAVERFDEASAAFDAAEAELEGFGANHELVELRRRRLELMLARSDVGGATRLGEALMADPQLGEVPVEAAQVRRLLAEAAVSRGDMDQARTLVEDAIERFDRLGCRHELAVARQTRARVMVATGKFETAILDVRRALEVHRAMGTRTELDRAAHILDEAEERYRRSDQSVRHAQILLELSMALGAARDIERLLPAAIDAVLDLVGAERGLVALFEDGELTDAVVRNLEWEGPDSPLPVSESVVDETLSSRRPVVVQDAVDSGAVYSRTSVALLGLRSIVCVPILRGDAVLGVLYLDSRRLVATDLDAEVELLGGVSRMLAVAIANARLFAAQEARNSALVELARATKAGLATIDGASRALGEAPDDGGRAALVDQITRTAAELSATVERALALGATAPLGTGD